MAESHLDRLGPSCKNDYMCLAIPGQIVSIADESPATRQGAVDFGGLRKMVNLAFVPEAAVGDFVLVHVGFAIAKVDPREAQRVFEYLRQVDELPELEPQ